ncbi:DNA cytosine methyltransferase [Amycolatopsis coloradensis]|uniref:DNA cytosine methyltransferase n=1 Tax=Amycolatopsis coloradensis TaxID=76021 RepID=A0ACD5B7M0_9PSEU
MSQKKASTRRIRAVDLFCGVGGLTHGLVRGGIEVAAGVDLDPLCRFPFEANNKAKFIEADVKEIDVDLIGSFYDGAEYSLLAGCAPCQPFSSYSQAGRKGKRSGDWDLVGSFGELVEKIQPDLVTMENVQQLSTHSVFADFLKSLKGYHVRWSIVECATIGVPQSRKRLVLFASKLGSAGLEITSSRRRIRTVRQTIGSLPNIAAGEKHVDDPLHASSRLSQINLRRIQASKPGGTWRDWEPGLQAACHQKESGANYSSVYGRMEWDKVAPTITTQCFGFGNGRFGHPEQDRAISLREAAMLQTFPRSYKFVRPDQAVRFSQLGRLIGNAVPVRLGEVIAETLVDHVAMHSNSVE